jgi:hypothetical protein
LRTADLESAEQRNAKENYKTRPCLEECEIRHQSVRAAQDRAAIVIIGGITHNLLLTDTLKSAKVLSVSLISSYTTHHSEKKE